MIKFIVYVNAKAVKPILNWLKHPDFTTNLPLIDNVKFVQPTKKADNYVAMIVSADDYLILQDLFDSAADAN